MTGRMRRRSLLDEIDRLRAENIRLVNLGKQMIVYKAVLRTERDAALEKLGECHAGYETMERQLAAARAEALEEARAACLREKSENASPSWNEACDVCADAMYDITSGDLQKAGIK